MRRSALLALILLVVPTLVLGCTTRRGGGGDDDDDGGGGGSNGSLAQGLGIVRATINQGVEIELAEEGSASSRNARVVAGRDALVRLYVHTRDGWEDRDIVGAFTLYDGEDEVDSWTETESIDGDSSVSSRSTTLDILVPGDAIEPGLSFTVSLHNAEPGSYEGSTSQSRWPEDGTEDLDATTAGPVRIALVPVQYNADGSGRIPDTGATQMERYTEWMERLFPTEEVQIEVQDAVGWNSTVAPSGAGWSELLDGLIGYRQAQGFPDDVYVYGIVNPASSYGNFCGGGCVAGLSIRVESAGDSWGRVSMGLGFPGEDVALTMTHEVGHAHGREHAPCGLGGQPSDSSYPYSGASIGAWGWDIVDDSLKNPSTYVDMMSYCDPYWVSDYTWDDLITRVRSVSAMARVQAGEDAGRWLIAHVDGDGQLRKGATELDLVLAPGGDPRTVEYLDSFGHVVEVAQGRFSPFGDLPGGLLLYPEPGDGVSSVRVDGRAFDL